jgi:hypothetical protein
MLLHVQISVDVATMALTLQHNVPDYALRSQSCKARTDTSVTGFSTGSGSSSSSSGGSTTMVDGSDGSGSGSEWDESTGIDDGNDFFPEPTDEGFGKDT